MNINATLLAQAVVFIVFIAICWKYVYPPILAAMQEREKKISDGLNAAKEADDALSKKSYQMQRQKRQR
jgi:F-type H+-transporting ATPase subunit b